MNAANNPQVSEHDAEAVAHRVSVILPVFNEEALIESSIRRLFEYAEESRNRFELDIVVVDDGSSDGTAEILKTLSRKYQGMRVETHARNRGLGAALRRGFECAEGDVIVVLDADLSYDVDHVGRMFDAIQDSNADVVLASPYSHGGNIANVPTLRLLLSRCANFFLSAVSKGSLSTYTCMVRAYRKPFVRRLFLRSEDMAIMPETVYKTQILGGLINEIPAELDWGIQNQHAAGRQSSMRILSHVVGTAVSGFMLRPFVFLLLPGFLMSALAAYCGIWMTIHTVNAYSSLGQLGQGPFNVTNAVALAFSNFPHTFVIGFLSLIVGTQLIGLAFLSFQSKKYFEDLFCLASEIRNRH